MEIDVESDLEPAENPVPVKRQRPMRIDASLENVTDEQLAGFAVEGPKYSESTLKNHLWVFKIYERYTQRLKIEMWPIQSECAGSFVRFLGLDVKYAIGTINDVIVPSLKRMNREHTGQAVADDVNQAFSIALSDIKKSKDSNKGGEGKEPIIYNDVKRIICYGNEFP